MLNSVSEALVEYYQFKTNRITLDKQNRATKYVYKLCQQFKDNNKFLKYLQCLAIDADLHYLAVDADLQYLAMSSSIKRAKDKSEQFVARGNKNTCNYCCSLQVASLPSDKWTIIADKSRQLLNFFPLDSFKNNMDK